MANSALDRIAHNVHQLIIEPGGGVMKEDAASKLMIGELLVQEGYITERQLQEAIARQMQENKECSSYLPLGEVCVRLKFISRLELGQMIRKHKKRIHLGDLLINMGLLTCEQVDEALEEQKIVGQKFGQILIDLGYITESQLIDLLSTQLGIPKIIPSAALVDPMVLKGISKAFLQKNECLPVSRDGDLLTVIMSDPLSNEKINTLENIFKCRIEPAIASPEAILKGIMHIYDDLGMVQAQPDLRSAKSPYHSLVITDSPTGEHFEDNIVNVANYLITSAVAEGATDIHIEPMENMLRVRFRIDGIMRHKTDLPLHMAATLSNRIKAVSGMDISDKRKHQDGRLGAQVMNKSFDLRISSYASITGEAITIRILPKQSNLMDLDMLGFSPRNLVLYKDMLKIPSGIIMITGPSGCGKTTTLYASVHYLNDREKKIITVEDPIEYTLGGIIQGQVSEKTGLSYKNCVKSILRHDPDIIMIGEIRDRDSAEAVIETCLTGHKVLTSFHTDDSIGALMRLRDIGIETFLISSTVMSIMSQRLVRTLCQHCMLEYTPDEAVLAAFDSISPVDVGKFNFFTAAGCLDCNNTGFKGRTAVSELLILNNDVRDSILSRTSSNNIRLVARKSAQLISMREDGFYKATLGITSLEEVARLVSYHESDALFPYSAEDIVAISKMER